MEYTVQRLARLAGVSARTLRYYDQIGLLCPRRQSSSGYRLYGGEEVDRLQQILFYRELGMPLEEIAALLDDPAFDPLDALRRHQRGLRERRDRLNTLIATVERTIEAKERSESMSDSDKFAGFKEKLIAENEAAYGAEIRQRYGEEAVNASNEKLRGMSRADFERAQALEGEILELLDAAFKTGDPGCGEARSAAARHREWLSLHWPAYTPEAHRGIAETYVADERFSAYYDRGTPGRAAFLRDAIALYLAEL